MFRMKKHKVRLLKAKTMTVFRLKLETNAFHKILTDLRGSMWQYSIFIVFHNSGNSVQKC